MELSKVLEFIKFTHKFQSVMRVIYVNGTDRNENDAEHAMQMSLLVWYLLDAMHLDLDPEKVLKYSLAHDLVEVYAGDTYFQSKDKSIVDSKHEREKSAAERIAKEFPEFPDLHQAIKKYEQREEREAKFVYALDKMIPVFNIYLDDGRSWFRDGVTLEMAHTKDQKVAVSPELVDLWKQMTDILDKEEDRLFPKI